MNRLSKTAVPLTLMLKTDWIIRGVDSESGSESTPMRLLVAMMDLTRDCLSLDSLPRRLDHPSRLRERLESTMMRLLVVVRDRTTNRLSPVNASPIASVT